MNGWDIATWVLVGLVIGGSTMYLLGWKLFGERLRSDNRELSKKLAERAEGRDALVVKILALESQIAGLQRARGHREGLYRRIAVAIGRPGSGASLADLAFEVECRAREWDSDREFVTERAAAVLALKAAVLVGGSYVIPEKLQRKASSRELVIERVDGTLMVTARRAGTAPDRKYVVR